MVCRVIIAALQIIEPGFDIIIVATVAQGVPVGQGRAGGLLIHQAVAVSVRNANQLAPCIVGIGGVDLFRPANEISVGILHRHGTEDFNHVPLLVQSIEVVDEAGAVIGGILDCKGGASRPPPVAEQGRRSEWPQQGDWRGRLCRPTPESLLQQDRPWASCPPKALLAGIVVF